MRSIPSLLAFLTCASRVVALGSSCSAPLGSGAAAAGDAYWMKTIPRQGSSSFNPNPGSYKVNHPLYILIDMSFDAQDTDAINRAISDMGRCGNLTCQSSSVEPALVYFPSGKYLVTKPIIPYYYTALVPLYIAQYLDVVSEILKTLPISSLEGILSVSPPVSLAGIAIIDADVYSGASVPAGGWNCPSTDNEWVPSLVVSSIVYCPVNNFFRSIRNFVIDTTNIPADQFGTGIHWQVGQATSLINLSFLLSTASGNKHQGVFMENGSYLARSGGFMADLQINGGAFGLWISNQQFTIQNVKITNSDTAIYQQWNWGFTFKNIDISGCRIGFGLNTNGQTEATQSAGSVTILDSSISASVAAVQTDTDQSQKLGGAVLLQNVNLNGSPAGVVDGANHVFLPGGGTVNQFILGNEYSGDSSTGTYNTVANPGPDLPPQLLDASSGNNGVFFRTRPQYENYAIDEFASAKSNGVKCDGTSDDTMSLQNFINKVSDLDAGTCLVSSTINIPTGSIVVGEFWTTILGSGAAFNDASNPQPVVRVGKAGDKGGVEISDIVVSTVGGSAGAVCIEWNPTGDAGTVGMWDVHVRIGGAIGTKIQVSQCPTTSTATQCMGAFLGLHVLGSGYFENVWVWTADHDLDDPGQGRINSFTARGILIDHAPGPVWLVGTASEHAVFYQYSIVGSQYVYAGMIQTETPYYQPTPAPPAPFSTNSAWNDPSWGNSGSAWALTVSQSSDVFVYGAGLYSFFVSYSQDCKAGVDCQKSLVLVDEDSAAIFIYQLSTIGATTMLTVGSTDVIKHSDNVDGLQSTVSKWAASKTTPNQPSGTPVGCAALQTQAVVHLLSSSATFGVIIDSLMVDGTTEIASVMVGFASSPSPLVPTLTALLPGICGHWPEPGTSSPGLSGQEWTNVNTFETLYNTMWQTGVTTASDLIEIQAIVPNEAHGSSNQLPVTRGFSEGVHIFVQSSIHWSHVASQDDAAWAGLMYLKVQQYNDAHGISESGKLPDPFYYHEALAIQQGLAKTWLASSGCGGGVPQVTSGTGPNTITTHLYFSLTVALAQYNTSDTTLRQNAQQAADWYTNGAGTTLRNAAGLWLDGQNSTCTGPNRNLWTYNQGTILSGMGAMATLTGNQSYIEFALKTVDAVVNVGTASGPLPQPTGADKHMEVVGGILAEGCDGAAASAPSICDHDQQYFKGAFMKHLQYFLDNVNNTIRDKYAAFVGAQASAVIHFGTRADGEIGEVWFAPDTGGSIYNYKTLTAGLDALNCAQKQRQKQARITSELEELYPIY
ncbi:pectate lyase superfamily protein-domain-containing protein [Mycena rosella]|uniref:Pectate lyase superfamily protein-domain-containing protein n=1 Tax=Mycena rosella TaxID=1033263 RepID=A0AAD7G5K3_MYCRO|nr:pectate lyase superfamily protein-domain-containing protein [Mycena rosella]